MQQSIVAVYEDLSRKRGGRSAGGGDRHGAGSTDSPNGCRTDNKYCECQSGSVPGTHPSAAPGLSLCAGGDTAERGGDHLERSDAEDRRVPDTAPGCRRVPGPPYSVDARHDDLGAAHPDHVTRAGLLYAGTGRAGRPVFHVVQVPHDDRRCGKARRPGPGDARRPACHAGGPHPAADAHR